MTKQELANFIDQTLLSQEATEEQVEKFCQQAKEYGFASVCINPVFVSTALKRPFSKIGRSPSTSLWNISEQAVKNSETDIITQS